MLRDLVIRSGGVLEVVRNESDLHAAGVNETNTPEIPIHLAYESEQQQWAAERQGPQQSESKGIWANPANQAKGLAAAGADNAYDAGVKMLDGGQRLAFDAALQGKSIFMTGGPGTGKSYTLRLIVKALQARRGNNAVMVMAPTGVAALITEGQTMHSRPGPGIPTGTTDNFRFMKSLEAGAIWRSVKVLVIDEISMVDAEFFDYYRSNVPAGVQLVMCGDFAQLPPVPDKQGSLNSEEFLRNCIYAARHRGLNETRDVAAGKDPAVDEGGWVRHAGTRISNRLCLAFDVYSVWHEGDDGQLRVSKHGVA